MNLAEHEWVTIGDATVSVEVEVTWVPDAEKPVGAPDIDLDDAATAIDTIVDALDELDEGDASSESGGIIIGEVADELDGDNDE